MSNQNVLAALGVNGAAQQPVSANLMGGAAGHPALLYQIAPGYSVTIPWFGLGAGPTQPIPSAAAQSAPGYSVTIPSFGMGAGPTQPIPGAAAQSAGLLGNVLRSAPRSPIQVAAQPTPAAPAPVARQQASGFNPARGPNFSGGGR